MVYNHFCSGRLAKELDCSTLDFTEQLSYKLWPWLGLQVGSHLLHVGSSLRVAAILGQLWQGCARAGRGKRNPERFLKAWVPCSQCKARPASPRSRGQGFWFLLKGAIVFKSREENMKTALDKLESIFESLSCDVILLSSIGDKIVNLINKS